MDCFMFLLAFLTTCAGFKVSAPAGRVVAVRGQPAILGCEFTPDSTSDLSALVVTWQRVEDSRVVHSFYYQQDQLDLQSPDYRNRTSLFMSELRKGNATLRIEPVGLRDRGEYLCTVSNNKGTDKAQVQLEYGAFYTEPRLSVNVSSSNVTLLYESEGFPKPEVRWFGEHGEVLSDHTELKADAAGADGAMGLYYLKSSYVSLSSSLNVTFTLKNQLLNQDLLRPVSITYGALNPFDIAASMMQSGENHSCGAFKTAIIVVCALCVLLFLIIIVLLIKMQRRACRHSKPSANGTVSGKKELEVCLGIVKDREVSVSSDHLSP